MKRSTLLALTLNSALFATVGYLYHDHMVTEEAVEPREVITVNPHPSNIEIYMASISDEDMYCLAQNIYFEARNQPVQGQRAVARVTLNRVDSNDYPDSICDVVWQRRQFSWTHDGLSDIPREQEAWELAQSVALAAVANHFVNRYDPTYGATHYHANYVDPYWADYYEEVAVVGDHIFYR
jgi:spore germination cell wall hydrolase CwlJ-like protein